MKNDRIQRVVNKQTRNEAKAKVASLFAESRAYVSSPLRNKKPAEIVESYEAEITKKLNATNQTDLANEAGRLNINIYKDDGTRMNMKEIKGLIIAYKTPFFEKAANKKFADKAKQKNGGISLYKKVVSSLVIIGLLTVTTAGIVYISNNVGKSNKKVAEEKLPFESYEEAVDFVTEHADKLTAAEMNVLIDPSKATHKDWVDAAERIFTSISENDLESSPENSNKLDSEGTTEEKPALTGEEFFAQWPGVEFNDEVKQAIASLPSVSNLEDIENPMDFLPLGTNISDALTRGVFNPLKKAGQESAYVEKALSCVPDKYKPLLKIALTDYYNIVMIDETAAKAWINGIIIDGGGDVPGLDDFNVNSSEDAFYLWLARDIEYAAFVDAFSKTNKVLTLIDLQGNDKDTFEREVFQKPAGNAINEMINRKTNASAKTDDCSDDKPYTK